MPDSGIYSTDDARRLARYRLPKLVFDYIDGAAGREIAAARNMADFDNIQLTPKVMRPSMGRSLKKKILGRRFDRPFGVAPMGMCNLSRPNADKIIALAASEIGAPVCLSAAASSTIEDMRSWAGENAWFQLYVSGGEDETMKLVDRVKAAGYDTLILTVDVPQVAKRARDMRNGFTMPFRIGPRQFIDFALHPRWSLATLFHGAPSPKNFEVDGGKFDRDASREGADWEFLKRLRDYWKGNLIIKGVLNPEDALRLRESGVDAIWVSNHGGRQLDSAQSAISALPLIRNALGADFPVFFDSGVRSGEDIARALALGADFVMLGRPVLYATGAAGAAGLQRLFDLYSSELEVVMSQLGVSDVEEIGEACLVNGEAGAVLNS